MSGLNETLAALRRRSSERAPTSLRMRPLTGFGANPGALRALYYAPDELAKNLPLVVALHGCTQSGEAYAQHAGWLDLADRYGFAVLAPEQARSNNANLCFNWFEPNDTRRDHGEAASIAQMVMHLVSAGAIDPKRVFITGLSAGGAMSAVMLAAYPEMFAAGAVIAGLPVGAANNMQSAFAAMANTPDKTGEDWGRLVRNASRHAGPWPAISIWHGEADRIVRPGASDALVKQWTNLHGVMDNEPVRSDDGQGRHAVWKSANGNRAVEHRLLRGMGHGAPLCTSGPDGCGTAAAFMLDVGVSSSLESARSWGIASAASAAEGTTIIPFTRPREVSAQNPAQTGGVDVNAIITSALRSAGLLR